MRPLRLSLQAFGSFAGKQEIDFRPLGLHSFFLIHGPTGAGKTTLLDAICYALYGETTGKERDARSLRSHLASPDTPTEVIFDFALGQETYRLERKPEQSRPKKRGEGTTIHPSQAVLWKRTGLENDALEGTVLAAQHSSVTTHIETLLGFKCHQFRQVVILPQGKFQEFLLAPSSVRQNILETLFQTEHYRELEELFKNRARDLEAKAGTILQRQTAILNQFQVTTEAEIQTLAQNISLQLAGLDTRLDRFKDQEEHCHFQLIKAQALQRSFQEFRDAEHQVRLLESQQENREKRRLKLDQARKAERIHPLEARLSDHAKDHALLVERLRETQAALAQAETRWNQEQSRHDGILAQKPERELLGHTLSGLTALLPRLNEKQDLIRNINTLESKIREQALGIEKSQIRLKDLVNSLDHAEQSLRLHQGSAAQGEGLRLRLESLLAAVPHRRRLDEARQSLAATETELTHQRRNLDTLAEELDTKRYLLIQAEASWRQEQAALLAQTLKPGQPCPVCGSKEHPAPFEVHDGLPIQAGMEQIRGETAKLEEQIETKKQIESKTDRVVHTLKSEIDTLVRHLGASGSQSLSQLDADIAQLRNELAQSQTAVDLAQRAQASIQQIKQDRESVTASLRLLETGRQETILRSQALQEKIRLLTDLIPQEFRDKLDLPGECRAIEARVQALDKTLAESSQTLEIATQEQTRLNHALNSINEQQNESTRKINDLRLAFHASLTESGFLNEEDYRAARLDLPAMTALEQSIQDDQSRLTSSNQRLAAANETIKDAILPDIPALEKNLAAVKVERDVVGKEHGALAERYRTTQVACAELGRIATDLKAREERYAVVGHLAEVASGKNPLRMTFERFVLASLLDEVLVAASVRLRVMSKGRYDLLRALEAADLRVSGGLDLLVYDAFSGTTRPVQTLSGGECFLASLSLALGLTDVVQNYAGGIRLDTIFIDEGFGSLDPESLDLALQTLMDQLGGNRLVGIISHVPELKERIEARLEVRPGAQGSTAVLHVPN